MNMPIFYFNESIIETAWDCSLCETWWCVDDDACMIPAWAEEERKSVFLQRSSHAQRNTFD